jgi:hypothetical protein
VETSGYTSPYLLRRFRVSLRARSLFRAAALAVTITLVALPIAAQSQSDREHDGLSGPVKKISVFLAFVDSDDGTYKEPKERFFDSAAWYNKNGKKTKEKPPEICLFDLPHKSVYDDARKLVEEEILNRDGNGLWGKITYNYDSKGILARSNEYDGKGMLYRTWTYSYEYDGHGNWIHQVLWMQDAKFFNGKTAPMPREVYYREISYY